MVATTEWECDACGEELLPGVDHECDVGGNSVRIELVVKVGRETKGREFFARF